MPMKRPFTGILRLVPLLLLVLLITPLPSAQAQGENLIRNGSFEEIDEIGLPVGWSADMWHTEEGVTQIGVDDQSASDGAYSAYVHNYDANDARLSQRVKVEPNTYYRLSGDIWAIGCDPEKQGATLSVEGLASFSREVHDQVAWQSVELVGKTGRKQKELVVWCRLGGYSAENIGTAHFDNIRLEKLDAAPAAFVDFQAPSPQPAQQGEDGDAPVDTQHLVPTLLMIAFLYALLGFFAYNWLQTRRTPFEDLSVERVLVLAMFVALAVRIYFAYTHGGHETDINCFKAWSMRMFESGPWGFYGKSMIVDGKYVSEYFADYPPGYMLLLWPIGMLRAVFSLEYESGAFNLLVKIPAILCDVASGYVLYRIARRLRLPNIAAAGIAIFMFLNPATIHNSTMWAQIDSVLALVLLLSTYMILEKRLLAGSLLYVAAFLIKPQALIVGPSLLLAYVHAFLSKDKPLATLLKYIGICVGAFVLFCLPFWGQQHWSWIFSKYFGTLESYAYGSVNAFNLFSLLGYNWVDQNSLLLGIPLYAIGHTLFFLALAFAGWMFLRSKELKTLPLISAFVVYAFFCLEVRQHERYMFSMLMLLPLAFLYLRDRRILFLWLACSIMQLLNNGIVLPVTHVIPEVPFLYSVMRVCGAVNLALLASLGWVVWDICGGRIREPRPAKLREQAPGPALPTLWEPGCQGRFHMTRLDALILAGITVVYAVVAFVNLGTLSAPETLWKSTAKGDVVIFDLGEPRPIPRVYYDVGMCSGNFDLEVSLDGVTYTPYAPRYAQDEETGEILPELNPVEVEEYTMFRWLVKTAVDAPVARYVRMTANTIGLVFQEIAFTDSQGNAYPVTIHPVAVQIGAYDPQALIDEQDTVPNIPSYYNGTYFDEIYHAGTAYEMLHNQRWHETTHPPLGKALIEVGIVLFGMNPFGWRVVGTFIGVLMLPVLYLILKLLMRRTDLAAAGTILFAFDFMHFVQTRIATIDVYGVFFIMLMYLFMFQYMMKSFYHEKLGKTLVPLFLCGLSMGLGIASKWIDIYAAVGLAVLLFYTLGRRYMEYREAGKALDDQKRVLSREEMEHLNLVRGAFAKKLLLTLASCVVFFVAVPLVIYVASYAQYFSIEGTNHTLSDVWRAQESMFSYHSTLQDDHPFKSPWWEWLVDWKPMWYFSGEFLPEGTVSSISAFGNPAVWWFGLIALLWVIVRFVKGYGRKDKRYVWILVGFAAQYLPWVLVPRSMFIYHYFASVPFLVLCIMLFFEDLTRFTRRGKRWMWVYVAVAVGLFVLFYPVLSGMPVSIQYAQWLRWMKSWVLFAGP